MKNLIYIVALFLPFICLGQKSTTYNPYYPQPVHYIDGGLVVAKSVRDSSTIVCYFSGREQNAIFLLMVNRYKNKAVFYENININDGNDIPIYTANEILEKTYRKFNSHQTWAAIAGGISANNSQQRSTTKANYNITNGYSNVNISGNSTTVSNDPSVSVEKMKIYNQNLRERASQFDEGMKKFADQLLYLPNDEGEMQGDVIINGKLKDEFIVKVTIGDDLHEFKFRKARR